MTYERKSTNVKAVEALEKIAECLEFRIWLEYTIHVDNLNDRSPSTFLTKGFNDFMTRRNGRHD